MPSIDARARRTPIIRTPDQRVRVFISSTINELAEERRAAREAITRLRLIPVFFEAGARPHPPRDLYAAYLDQSHIFLGIYWNSYGWIAPGAAISGLEDEYRLSSGKPRLIYVKRSPQRDPRLMELLADIEKSDSASYQVFTDAGELGQLIENDLSVLISETFEDALSRRAADREATADTEPRARRVDLPQLRVTMVGRDADLEAVATLLMRPDVNLVTVLGAGGTGKTTLASHVAHRVQEQFADGAVFVPLAPVTDYRLAAATIAEVLGVQDSGKQPVEATLAEFLADKQLLLVLDNFEQIADASRLVSDIVMRAPAVRVLVTSRTSLHVRSERIYHLAPLAAPAEGTHPTAAELTRYPAAELFLERARAVNRNLELTPENTEAIAQICQRLDGLPLAIELAAARTRFFQPAALMSRIGRALDLVSKGHRDLPERQQTLRAAIDWSYNLLSEDLRRAFRQLGVFRRSWTLEASDIVLGGSVAVDVVEITERLLDVSLIQPVPVSHALEPRFTMLQTVHEYALEALMASPEAADTTQRYAEYFQRLCLDAEPHLWGATSEPWLDKLEHEYQNVRAAFHVHVERGNLAAAWQMIPPMARYWSIRGGFTEGADWVSVAGVEEFERHSAPPFDAISRELAGKAMTWAAFIRLQLFQLEAGFALLHRAEALLRDSSDELSLAYAVGMDGCYGAHLGRDDASAKILEAGSMVRRLDDPMVLLFFLTWSSEYYRRRGEDDVVRANLDEATRIASDGEHLHILGNLYAIHFGLALLEEPIDLDRVAHDAESLLRRFPEKGYKSLKGAAMYGLAFSHVMRGQLDAAFPLLRGALECAREGGEPEGQFFGTMAAAHYYGLVGNRELALKLLGAVDQFVALTGYPLVEIARRQYELARAAASPDGGAVENQPAWREGRKLRIDEAVVLALHA